MSITVIKNTKLPYDAYWNEKDQKWSGLLLATHYGDGDTLPVVENGSAVDYFELVMPKKNTTNSTVIYAQ